MVVMGVWAFTLCTEHRRHKTKEQKSWNNTKQTFPEQNTKKSFALVICVQYTKFWMEFGIH